MVDPYKAFAADVPDHLQEDILIAMAEAAGSDSRNYHDHITIIERDRIDAVNVRAYGMVEINGRGFSFQIESGDRSGTVLLDWDTDRAFARHIPTKYALQPMSHIVNKAFCDGETACLRLLRHWDSLLARDDIKNIARNYMYDRYVKPGYVTETYWRRRAAKNDLEIVSEEAAAKTRDKLCR